jgi:hypothetical protein
LFLFMLLSESFQRYLKRFILLHFNVDYSIYAMKKQKSLEMGMISISYVDFDT